MRTLLAAILTALFLTALVPNAASQADAEAPLVEDPSGDVTGNSFGTPTPALGGFEDVDLTGLWLTETPTTFELRLRFAHMDGEPGPDQPSSYTFLTFDGVETRVWLGRSADNEAWFGSFSSREGDGAFRYVGQLNVRYDVGAAEVWTSIDRDLIVGASGRSPGNGDAITDIRAQAWANAGHAVSVNNPPIPVKGFLLDVGDRVPDIEGATLAVLFGGATSSGGISLAATEPYRASNGAATTYLYDLEAANQGDLARSLALEAMHLPAGWNVTLPGSVVTLEPGATVKFQVALSTSFYHDHGTSQSFHLRLADDQDESAWAMAELGVHYLDVPQPAGHHDTLFLHTHPWSETAAVVNPPLGGTTGIVTMNTLEQDPEDAGVPVVGYSWVVSDSEHFGWASCLDPGLAMGLDFDLARTGLLTFPVRSERPILGAVLSGRLLRVAPGLDTGSCYPSSYADLDVIELATIDATAPTQIGPAGTHTFEATITPLAAADRVPYEDGAALVLELTVVADGVGIGGTGGVALQPGGSLSLPLNEYSDAAPMFGGVTAAPDGATFSDAAEAPAKDAPGVAVPALVGLLALLVVARRR
ncbi:MAG: hypothetical protein AABY18_00740 [Candidatus Thermoplasmatota archaeon]